MKPTHTFIRVPVSYDENGYRTCRDCPMGLYKGATRLYYCTVLTSLIPIDPYGNVKPHVNCPIDKVLNENDD